MKTWKLDDQWSIRVRHIQAPLALVEFYDGENYEIGARFDVDKRTFIDGIPTLIPEAVLDELSKVGASPEPDKLIVTGCVNCRVRHRTRYNAFCEHPEAPTPVYERAVGEWDRHNAVTPAPEWCPLRRGPLVMELRVVA